MIALEAIDLAIGYRGGTTTHIVADNLTLSVASGEVICLLGQNGAGKSTLLRTLAGMQPSLKGAVRLGGDTLNRLSAREKARRLALVTTERVDAPMMTAQMLVSLGRHPYTDWTGQLTPNDKHIILHALALVGAQALAARRVAELSDGERQRIMIARALAQEPSLLMLDEPTAFLDLPRRIDTMQLLRRLAREQGYAVLLSTHDLDLALRTADRIWLMSAEGILVQGAPEDLVLDGTFEQAFAREGVHFDAMTGTFRMLTTIIGSVSVEGEGLRAIWTRRALERAGYHIGAGGSYVTVTPDHWQMSGQAYASVSALLEGLTQIHSGDALSTIL